MDIILKEDVKGLGYKHDLVKVRDGYGRNFLIPKNLAMVATDGNRKMREELLKQSKHKTDRVLHAAQSLAERMAAASITITAKVGENGRLFGGITTRMVEEALKAQGVEVDRRRLDFDTEPKTAGTYTVTADLHREVKGAVTVNVVPEGQA